MPSLKNPQLQIPGGFQFYVAETKFTPAPFSSLDSIVQQLISHRRGRPDLVAARGWSLDPVAVYQEVLAYQVAVCERNGWGSYLEGGSESSVPFPVHIPQRRGLRGRARAVVEAVEFFVDWKQDGQPVVSQELANKRAETCVACPMNGQGGFEAYFTVPAQAAIQKQLERKRNMKLATPSDDALGICTACDCPLKLKVWMPLENILKKMPQESQDALHENCWIRRRDA